MKPLPWFRLYADLMHNPKVQALPAAVFKGWINTLCYASQCRKRGHIDSAENLAFALRMKPCKARQLIAELVRAGLLHERDSGDWEVHDWGMVQCNSDQSAYRVARHRERKRNQAGTPVSSKNSKLNGECNVTATPPDIEIDITPPNPPLNGGGREGNTQSRKSKSTAEERLDAMLDRALADFDDSPYGQGQKKRSSGFIHVGRLIDE